MTFQEKLSVITVLSAATAGLLLARPAAPPPAGDRARSDPMVAASLAVLAGALIVVGIVSHSLVRHIIQIAPVLVALMLVLRGTDGGVNAAAPLFAFWLLIMGSIWLFLLGIARIFSGKFTPIEIALTIIIGVASVGGLVTVYRHGGERSPAERLGLSFGFAVLQFAAMWISVLPFVARADA